MSYLQSDFNHELRVSKRNKLVGTKILRWHKELAQSLQNKVWLWNGRINIWNSWMRYIICYIKYKFSLVCNYMAYIKKLQFKYHFTVQHTIMPITSLNSHVAMVTYQLGIVVNRIGSSHQAWSSFPRRCFARCGVGWCPCNQCTSLGSTAGQRTPFQPSRHHPIHKMSAVCRHAWTSSGMQLCSQRWWLGPELPTLAPHHTNVLMVPDGPPLCICSFHHFSVQLELHPPYM